MRQEELMLGDLVIYKDEVCKVTILSTNGSIGVVDKHNATTVVQGKELSPISITPEILKANGFMPGVYMELGLGDGKWLEYYPYEHRFRMWWEGVDEWDNHNEVKEIIFQCHVWYVHELQHALRLCKIEKEIKV